jgi:hypothetical protein
VFGFNLVFAAALGYPRPSCERLLLGQPGILGDALPTLLGRARNRDCTRVRALVFVQKAAIYSSYHDHHRRYELALEENRNKELSNTLRTPLMLGGAAFASHIFATVLGVVGLSGIAALLSLLTWALMGALGFWGYCQYSGLYSDMAVQVATKKVSVKIGLLIYACIAD